MARKKRRTTKKTGKTCGGKKRGWLKRRVRGKDGKMHTVCVKPSNARKRRQK